MKRNAVAKATALGKRERGPEPTGSTQLWASLRPSLLALGSHFVIHHCTPVINAGLYPQKDTCENPSK